MNLEKDMFPTCVTGLNNTNSHSNRNKYDFENGFSLEECPYKQNFYS